MDWKRGVLTGKEWEGKQLGPGVGDGVRAGACRPGTLKMTAPQTARSGR